MLRWSSPIQKSVRVALHLVTQTNLYQFLDSVQQLWSNIPKATRTSVDGNLGNEQLENNRPRKYRKLTRSNKSDRSDNTLPPGLMAKVSDWKDNPLSFFDEGGVQLNLKGAPLAHAYNYLIRLVKRTDMDIIRGRLLKVVFHRLKERLGVQRLRSDRVEQIARIICRSGIVKESDANTIRKWLDEGNRFDGLCREIGSILRSGYSYLGNLFYLNHVVDSR